MGKYKKVYYIKKKADLEELFKKLDQQGYRWMSDTSLSLKDNYTRWFINTVEFPIAILAKENARIEFLKIKSDSATAEFIMKLLRDMIGAEILRYESVKRSEK